MRRPGLILGILLITGLASGCRTPLMNPYFNAVDDLNDTHVYLDRSYMPRWDISRAGKPDWCGPVNNHLAPGICYLGCWDRYDDDNLYPPSNPYTLPSYTMPPPRIRYSSAAATAPLPPAPPAASTEPAAKPPQPETTE